MVPTKLTDTVRLNSGIEMPWLGLGVFQMTQPTEAEKAVIWALEAGYRSIDTATVYRNEEEVGRGIRASSVDRQDIFLTTKVWNSDLRENSVRKAFENSLRLLDTDYIDLYLIHWPVAGHYKAAWDVLQKILEEGKVRAIGVSNFMENHLDDLLADSDVVPAVNQIEYHPRLVQPELMDYCRNGGIRVESWSPLMQGGIFRIPQIGELARKHNKNAVQIVLRWNIQNGVIAIPKSSHQSRIIENAEIFDFQLDSDDMAILDSLNQNTRTGPDPRNFDF